MNQNLVSTEWLAQHLHDSNLRIIDIRGHVLPASDPLPHYHAHHEDYVNSHIEGAVFVDWTKDIVKAGSPSQDIAEPDVYAALMSELGIDEHVFVVAYDAADSMFAARMWWTLNYYGHSQVAVLDGGWKKWTTENRLVTADIPSIQPRTFVPKINPTLRQTADDILARSTQIPLVDVRTVAEFNGQASRAKRKGHIPGALNLPRQALVNPDGTMPSSEALRVKFLDAGIKLDAPEIITYCNGGVSASYVLLALKEAGYDKGSLYDGSWKDWGNDESKPIE
jgi:thiosulfate/3-mercaptopyruvate sulfurtransferase